MLRDLKEALKFQDLWQYLAWNDIAAKYRRTTLGPFWIIMVTFVSIACMAVLGSLLFKVSLREFLPHVACGMVVWGFLNTLILECCTVFTSYNHILQNTKLPVLAFVLRIFVRNTLLFLHSLLIILLIIVFSIPVTWKILLVIPALFIIGLNTLSFGIILGFFAARYRDIQYIIQTILGISMLITPIMWKKEMLGEYSYLADLNPFTHFIAIFREPMLGNNIGNETILYISAITIISFIFAHILYSRFKTRLIFWL